jgi:hypothetical protein
VKRNARLRLLWRIAHAAPVVAALLACSGIPDTAAAQDSDTYILNATYHFTQTQGAGTEVCDALLERLRKTKWKAPPYCDLTEATSVAGFERLHRVPLPESEIATLYAKVHFFTRTQRQGSDYGLFPSEISGELGYDLFAWRYSPPLSVGNDGSTDNVIVWQGFGLSNTTSLHSMCGSTLDPASPEDGVRINDVALVLAKNNSDIDVERTKELFMAPTPNPIQEAIVRGPEPNLFVPIGETMGFVRYRGLTYMTTFESVVPFTGEATRRVASQKRNRLMVVLRQNGVLKQMCEYQMTIRKRK